MCGVVGYVGKNNALPVLINGLQKMEYRGYDSSGVCIKKDNELLTIKKTGRIAILEQNIDKDLTSNIGIAHTRWATHGEPSDVNSHPHSDCKNEFSIVHNGIIENYNSLKTILESEGHIIKSKTDSEIIAHMVEKFYNGENFEEAVFKTISTLEGTYGIIFINKKENKLIAVRNGSPMILGIGEGEFFIASDVSAVLKYTQKVIYLDDGDFVIVDENNYEIKNKNKENISHEISEITWTIDSIEKEGYKSFMLKEIFEQPKVIKNTISGRYKDGEVKLSVNIDINSIKRILILACGTSWHSALIAKTVFEKQNKIPTEVDYASEFRYRNPLINKDDLVIAISQSGETADTLAAIREAKSKGAKTLGIVNVVGSTIAREVDSGVYVHAGPEIGVASTKAFTCQNMALLLLSLFFKKQQGLEIEDQIKRGLENISDKMSEALEEDENIKRIADKYKDSKNFIYLGRGINFPVALEGALKLKEISYIHAEGYPAAEMKHGPIALIDANMPVVFIAPKDKTFDKIVSNMQEIKARGGKIICLTNDVENDLIKKLSDDIIKIPTIYGEFASMVNILPLQLLSYYIADYKGLDVDKPRNLAKSVTVE